MVFGANGSLGLAIARRLADQGKPARGAGPVTGRQFLRMVFEAAGAPPRISAVSGGAIRFFALFSVDAREMGELMYEFEEPLILEGGKFARAFPSFGYTPHNEAIRQTLGWFRQHR